MESDEYRRTARCYEPLLGPFLAPARRQVRRTVLGCGFDRVLDLCCGTGEQCAMLAREGLDVHGADRSPFMLQVARGNARSGPRYVLADAASLPYPDALFDGVVLSFALHEKPPHVRQAMLRECERVLKPEGGLVAVDFVRPRGGAAKAAHAFVRLVERAAGGRHYLNFKDFMGRGGLDALLRDAGWPVARRSLVHWGAVGVALARPGQGRISEDGRDTSP